MFFIIAIVVGIIVGIVCYKHDDYGSSRLGSAILAGFLCTLLAAAALMIPCLMTEDTAETIVVNKTYTELVPLNHIYPDEYAENDYILYKGGRYCFYVKNEDGVIDYKQIYHIDEIRFDANEPVAYVFEDCDFEDVLLNSMYPQSFCTDYYYLNLPKNSEITYVITEGDK